MSFRQDPPPTIFFHKQDRLDDGFLSNFFRLPGNPSPPLFFDPESRLTFSSSEQYYMVAKAAIAGDWDAFIELMRMENPMDIKDRASRINLTQTAWETSKKGVMEVACYLKFSQNESLKQKLLATGDAELIEASPKDGVWGIRLNETNAKRTHRDVAGITTGYRKDILGEGYAWYGKNWLGITLMILRDKLRRHGLESPPKLPPESQIIANFVKRNQERLFHVMPQKFVRPLAHAAAAAAHPVQAVAPSKTDMYIFKRLTDFSQTVFTIGMSGNEMLLEGEKKYMKFAKYGENTMYEQAQEEAKKKKLSFNLSTDERDVICQRIIRGIPLFIEWRKQQEQLEQQQGEREPQKNAALTQVRAMFDQKQEENLQSLNAMGFDRSNALRALENNGNDVERAADFLLKQLEQQEQQQQQQSQQQPQERQQSFIELIQQHYPQLTKKNIMEMDPSEFERFAESLENLMFDGVQESHKPKITPEKRANTRRQIVGDLNKFQDRERELAKRASQQEYLRPQEQQQLHQDPNLQQLVDMGFSKDNALRALKKTQDDVQKALEILLMQEQRQKQQQVQQQGQQQQQPQSRIDLAPLTEEELRQSEELIIRDKQIEIALEAKGSREYFIELSRPLTLDVDGKRYTVRHLFTLRQAKVSGRFVPEQSVSGRFVPEQSNDETCFTQSVKNCAAMIAFKNTDDTSQLAPLTNMPEAKRDFARINQILIDTDAETSDPKRQYENGILHSVSVDFGSKVLTDNNREPLFQNLIILARKTLPDLIRKKADDDRQRDMEFLIEDGGKLFFNLYQISKNTFQVVDQWRKGDIKSIGIVLQTEGHYIAIVFYQEYPNAPNIEVLVADSSFGPSRLTDNMIRNVYHPLIQLLQKTDFTDWLLALEYSVPGGGKQKQQKSRKMNCKKLSKRYTRYKKILYKYSNPKQAQKMATKYLGKTAKLYPANNPVKKYRVCDPVSKKWVNFGQLGYEDYTRHKDKTRRHNYLTRTANMRGNWKKNKYSANNLSRKITW